MEGGTDLGRKHSKRAAVTSNFLENFLLLTSRLETKGLPPASHVPPTDSCRGVVSPGTAHNAVADHCFVRTLNWKNSSFFPSISGYLCNIQKILNLCSHFRFICFHHFFQFHKPTEANISSMSSWMSESVVWCVSSCVILLHWFSFRNPNTDKSVPFRRPLCVRFTPVLTEEAGNRLLSDWNSLFSREFLFMTVWKWKVFGTDSFGDKAQQASCLKVCSFLWTLRTRTGYTSMFT